MSISDGNLAARKNIDNGRCSTTGGLEPSQRRSAPERRLTDAGLASVDERGTTCCYARQDKFWVQGAPDGEPWEIYTVLADSQTFAGGSCG